ncbi:MAG: glycosyltransferase family 4 protein [Proteobacteria bacterium]|nr:glycosyltransferase family 4 protein [Pseudomonadota bacterium]
MKSCLLIECCDYHWEVFPAWANLLGELGCAVDIVCPDTPGHLETLAMMDVRRFPIERLWELPFDRYDLVLIGTLRHEGYYHDHGIGPLPGLNLIERIGRPSISVIHEPTLWVEQRPVMSFDGRHSRGEGIVNLFPDHSYNWVGRWVEECRWSQEGDRLVLSENGNRIELESTDGGVTFLGVRNKVLCRRPQPQVDLEGHTRSGRHAIVSFSRQGAEHLRARCPDAAWILPFESLEPPPPAAAGEYVFAGSIDYENKAMASLVRACSALAPHETLVVLGGGRSTQFDENPHVRRLKDDLAALGVGDKVRFTGYQPYDSFIEHVRSSRFLLPLVDDRIANGDYRTRMTATIPLSLGLGVPMIINEAIARHHDLDFMVTYPGEDLAVGLAAARGLSDGDYARLRERTLAAARHLKLHNIETLSGILRRITA